MLADKLIELLQITQSSRSALYVVPPVNEAGSQAWDARFTFGTNNRLRVTPIITETVHGPCPIRYNITRVYGNRQGTAYGLTEEEALDFINGYEFKKGSMKWDRVKN